MNPWIKKSKEILLGYTFGEKTIDKQKIYLRRAVNMLIGFEQGTLFRDEYNSILITNLFVENDRLRNLRNVVSEALGREYLNE